LAFGTWHSRASDGLDSLSDDALLDELARRNQTALLERAFELNKTPEATRNGIRAIAALARLRADAGKMSDDERRTTVANVCAGINTILPTMTDPKRVAEQADALIGAGVLRDVNTLEYWGPSVSAQAQLRPVVETVIKLLEKADALAQERASAFAEKANPNVPGDMKRVEEMEQLGLVAQQSKALAGYYLALCYDPSDANRAKVADESIAYLEGFDADGNPARENLKLALGKLHATIADFDKARADLDFVINAPPAADAAAGDAAQQKLRQFEARYFRAVVEVQAKSPTAARAKYDELLAWQSANPSDDPAIATADALLDYRIAAIEPGQNEHATKLLIDLLARRPDLEVPIMAQLRSGIAQDAAVTSLAPLQLRSLVTDAQEQVVRNQRDAQFKPDPNVVSRGLDAATELVARRGKPGVNDRVAADAQFLSGAFLESLDRKAEAAGRYLDFAEANKASVDAAKAALSNAQRLFAQLGGLKSGDESITKLYDRILPLSLGEPFNQKELAYDWAYRLQQLDRPDEAAAWYAKVDKTDTRYAASRYYLMVALSQSMDALPAGSDKRAAASKQIQSLADEVRADVGKSPADARGRQRLVRTSLLAASIARTEQNDPKRALDLLKDIGPAVEGLADADELLGEAMFTRVQSNMQLGDTDAAVKELVQLLDRSGGARGAQVVFNMLSKLERDFGQAQANGDRTKMAQLQANRGALTPYLVKWAEKNSSADVRKFTYSYRVYDAETQRLAATFLGDPAVQKARREQAQKLFESLDSEEGRKQFAASRDPASPAKLAYDPQVALGLARIRYDAQDWSAARDAYARLLADRALGTAIATVRDAGQEKQSDNDAYWEATLRLIDAKAKAGDDVEPLKVLLREQTIRWGDRVGGKQWAGLAKALREQLIPDFEVPGTPSDALPSAPPTTR
jgi:hypothetical protein